jgi:uncharacterized protein (DUF362 family)
MTCKKKEKVESESRRKFIKTISGAAASAVVLGAVSCKTGGGQGGGGNETPQILSPRAKKTNPFVTGDGKPLLISVQGTDFTQMLAAGLSALGGLGLLIDNDQDVLINPNCNHVDPYPGISSASSVADIVREVKQVTGGTVSVGDEGYENTSSVYGAMGLNDAVANAGGVTVNFHDTYRVRRSNWASSKPDFYVFTDVYDAPILIGTCVPKRHHIASFTCAIKNNVGTVLGSGASGTRDYLHYRSDNFMYDLAEIAGVVNPELVIVDARSILTVTGPTLSGGGIVVDIGKVIISGDLVATDAYCAQIMADNDSTFSVDNLSGMFYRAEELGMGTSDLSQVEIIEIST